MIATNQDITKIRVFRRITSFNTLMTASGSLYILAGLMLFRSGLIQPGSITIPFIFVAVVAIGVTWNVLLKLNAMKVDITADILQQKANGRPISWDDPDTPAAISSTTLYNPLFELRRQYFYLTIWAEFPNIMAGLCLYVMLRQWVFLHIASLTLIVFCLGASAWYKRLIRPNETEFMTILDFEDGTVAK